MQGMEDLRIFYTDIPFPVARHLFNVGSDKLDWDTGEVLNTFITIDTRLAKMQTLHADLVHAFDNQMKNVGCRLRASDFDLALKQNLVSNGKLGRYLDRVQVYQDFNALPISDDRSDELVLILVQNLLLAQLLLLQTVCVATAKNASADILNKYSFGLVDTWEGYVRYQILSSAGEVFCYDINLGDLVAFWPTETWDRLYDYGLKALTDETTSPIHVFNFVYAGVAVTKADKIETVSAMKWPIAFADFKQLHKALRNGDN